jgi:hypothetical protein
MPPIEPDTCRNSLEFCDFATHAKATGSDIS